MTEISLGFIEIRVINLSLKFWFWLLLSPSFLLFLWLQQGIDRYCEQAQEHMGAHATALGARRSVRRRSAAASAAATRARAAHAAAASSRPALLASAQFVGDNAG